MRRTIAAIGLALVSATAVVSGAHAQEVSVTPTAGNHNTTFSFRGAGFPPGTRLETYFISPTDEDYELVTGEALAISVVGPDGTFRVQGAYSQLFDVVQAGTWTAEFCVEGTDDCWYVDFDIVS